MDEREPERIRPDLVDRVERVDDVADGLAHLRAGLGPDQAVEVDGLERCLVEEMDPEHHHPGDPEEDDVVAGLHHRPRVEPAQIGGVVRPAEGRERPQPRAEPGVEDVGVLDELGGRPATRLAGRRTGRIVGHADVAVRAVPGRDPVTPPQLPADVPVADLGQPVLPDLDEPVGQDPRAARPGGLQRRPGQRRRPDEPLGLEQRLDDVVRALAAPDDHLVRLGLDEVATSLEVGQDPGARLEPVEAGVRTGGLGHPGGPVHDRDRGQIVPLPGRVVIRVVGRRDLDRPGPELRLDDRVGDDRHGPIDERDERQPADELGVAWVVRMDRDGDVAEDRLGPGRGDRDRLRGQDPAVRVEEVVADRPQRPGLGRRDDLEVADRGPTARAPVHEGLGPVRQVLSIQAGERRPDGLRRDLVHRVPGPAPVERRAQPSALGQDRLAGRRDVRDHPLEVALTAQAVAALALRGDDPVEHELGADPGVVEAGQPERRAAEHPLPPDDHVLDVGRQGMPDVERPGHVRRRLDDDERRLGRVRPRPGAVGREDVGGQPALVDRGLELGRQVGLGQTLPCSGRVVGHRDPHRNRTPRSPSGRTGSWYHLLVRGRAPGGHPVGGLPVSSWRAIGRRPHGSRVTFTSRFGRAARTVPRSLGPLGRYSSRSMP